MSQVIVKRLSTGSRIVLKSHYGYEIDKVNIFQDQYLVASTSETILIGDLATCKLSEIPWTGSGKEKYYFENPLICMVFNAGELSLVEYGVNEVLGSCRTEHMNPHLISVRLNERKCAQDVKLIAFLVDLLTVNIVDLISGSIVASISHDEKVDWLELSGQGKKLLFRDKKRQLHIFDIATQTRTTLLGYCTYVQWVPNSDVVVAQSRGNLCIWYSIDSPERVTLFPIKGEIEDIERVDGKTEVIVDEGVNTVSYTLDEGLIEFGTAIEDHDYDRAINLLESLELTSETEAMWNSLAQTALADRKLHIAERCYAALGDVSKTRYLNVLKSSLGTSGNDSIDSFQNALVRAKLAVLDKQFKLAESIYLEQGKVDEAMAMYQEMHKWDMSIKVAETKNHPDLEHLKKNYFQWLVESGQEEAAGSWKEEERDYSSAISLYLKGGMPSRAAAALDLLGIHNARDQADRVASALYQSSMFENAGSLYEKLGNNEKALEAYRKGRSYRLAVELARLVFPDQVVKLEEQWGDYLVSQKQLDSAVNHFIEAGKSVKAIDAAIASKQFKKAVSIVDTLSPRELAKPYFVPLAKYFSQTKDFEQAEHFYVAAGRPQDAVDMYTKSNKWDKAHRLAVSYMSQEEVSVLYLCQAKDLEIHGKFKDAEVLYLTIKEPDLAINMYKKHKQYENMVRLVAVYHKDLLDETHLFLAKTLEADASYGQAEKHYVEGKDWKSVINMYCVNNLYEEAYRAGKTYGGPNSAKQVAYMWARSLGGEAAVKLLCKLDLLDAALDFATENGAFDFAFELSRFAGKYKIEEIHYKHAMYLEDEGKFKEAECAFILAGKPREAILMFIHNEDWDKALKVAEEYEPASVVDVLVGQAKLLFTHNDHVKGESLILRAQKPELAITWYKESDNWKEALRFCKQHIPAKLSEISAEYDLYLAGKTDSGRDHLLATALQYEKQNDYIRAIEIYLKLNSNHTNNLDLLEKKWCRAVELALKFVPDNVASVVAQACKQLVDIGRHTAAGDMYFSLDMHKEAIIAFAAGGLWDRANAVAAVAPKYQEYLDAIYLKSLKTSGNDDIMLGDSSKALEVYADRGDWTKCLEIAKLQNVRKFNSGSRAFGKILIKIYE